MTRFPRTLLLALSLATAPAHAVGLNDTGQVREHASAPAAAGSNFTDRIIVKFRGQANYAAALAPALTNKAAVSAGVALGYSHAIANGAHVLRLPTNSPLADVQAMADRLRANPDIEYAEPDQRMYTTLVPNDTQYVNQWHYHEYPTVIGSANLPAAWDITTGAASVVAAVIDTGLVAHADIDSNILDGNGRVVAGYDFIGDDLFVANDGDGRDGDPSDPGDWTANNDCYGGWVGRNSSWHGTHVAGTIGALSNNGSGVAGINWTSKIQPLRVLGKCGGYNSDVADAIYWAAGLSVPGVPANATPAKVMNLSLGGDGACSATYQNAIDAAVGAGAVVVVSAGNSNANAADFQPASCNNVITVGATTRTGFRALYSNKGSVVEISAPGGDDVDGVLSTLNTGTTTPVASPTGDTYVYYQGTSMAAPHVTGVVSLMFSINPSLTPAQVLSILQSTAHAFAVGSVCNTPNTCGAGIVNAAAAVAAVADITPDAFTFVDQSNVALSSTITSAPVQITGINTTTWTASGGTACVSSTNSCACNVAVYAGSGSILNNQYMCARHTSSASNSTATNTVVTVGGVPDTFTSTTLDDTVPGGFTFIDQSNVPLSTVITSAPVQITGINTTTNWTASGGTACVSSANSCTCDVATYAASGSILNNQYLCARHTSSANYSTATNTPVTVGGVSDTFTSTTVPVPPLAALPLPTGPTVVPGGGACAPLGAVVPSNTAAFARPLGELFSGNSFYLTLNLGPIAGLVDIYVVAQLPNGQQLMLNSQKQWLPFPPATPFIANTLGPVVMTDIFSSLFMSPVSGIPPGSYFAYLLTVPAGTNPASFSLATSPYYLWCASKTF
jgi:serine protease